MVPLTVKTFTLNIQQSYLLITDFYSFFVFIFINLGFNL